MVQIAKGNRQSHGSGVMKYKFYFNMLGKKEKKKKEKAYNTDQWDAFIRSKGGLQQGTLEKVQTWWVFGSNEYRCGPFLCINTQMDIFLHTCSKNMYFIWKKRSKKKRSSTISSELHIIIISRPFVVCVFYNYLSDK